MHKGLSSKVALLAKQEEERSHSTLKATGKKYGEVWGSKDQKDRREFLRAYGVKVWVWDKGADGSARGMAMDLGDFQAMVNELTLTRPGRKDKMAKMVISRNVTEEQRRKASGSSR